MLSARGSAGSACRRPVVGEGFDHAQPLAQSFDELPWHAYRIRGPRLGHAGHRPASRAGLHPRHGPRRTGRAGHPRRAGTGWRRCGRPACSTSGMRRVASSCMRMPRRSTTASSSSSGVVAATCMARPTRRCGWRRWRSGAPHGALQGLQRIDCRTRCPGAIRPTPLPQRAADWRRRWSAPITPRPASSNAAVSGSGTAETGENAAKPAPAR